MKLGRILLSVAAGAAALVARSAPATPIAYNGGTYAQDFDSLPNDESATFSFTGAGPFDLTAAPTSASGLDGWQIWKASGSSANMEFKVQNGSASGSAGRGALSLGSTSSAERALGSLATSNVIADFGAVFTNNTANTYTSFTLSYTGEQWRDGGGATANVLTFNYGLASAIDAGGLLAATGLNFTAPTTVNNDSALDGNDPANQAAVSGTVTGLNWAPGTSLVIRWADADDSGQDDALGIDNVSFSAAVPEPANIALIGVAMAWSLKRARRK